MQHIALRDETAELTTTWTSYAVGRIGATYLKIMRMDELPVGDDVHADPEALLVVDGRLEMTVDGEDVSVGPGELLIVPGHAVHSIRPGSHGTLFLVNLNPPDAA
ncbi:cupin domain-containing protein [Yinghuangia seranimata]|uniref:cupin domain-containing protein n=1 Tax=Yinghuangia seranimata TaxID=408067 RepID=UPI00248C8AA6|nr:cupin domain-containing protein [Yinghuangia seranimata]MDI2126466.1 cupin domain-containing protein [Yinghuangia seranimata]